MQGENTQVFCLRKCNIILDSCRRFIVINMKGGRMGIWAPPNAPQEIDWLLVPPGKAYTLLTDHLITG